MTVAMIDRVVDQLAVNGVETVNLGGNEPLFTNGANPRNRRCCPTSSSG